MNNHEKIDAVGKIVKPYFNFEMDDFYGDRGGAPYPKIENLKYLYFKKNGKDRKLVITNNEIQVVLDKIKELNIGKVELVKFPYIGTFIQIKVYE